MNDPNASAMLAFLRAIRSTATHLFLVGDIFDLWIGSHDWFVREYASIVEAIRDLLADGIEVSYFEGNHDLYLGKFWEHEVGVRVYREAALFQLAGRTVRVEHGDLINLNDHGYLVLRRVLHWPLIEWLALRLPGRVVQAIGERASRASRVYTSTSKRADAEHIREMVRAHAERKSALCEFDLLISGHVHVVDDWILRVGPRSVRSVNLGSWHQAPRAFCVTDFGAEFLEQSRWPG